MKEPDPRKNKAIPIARNKASSESGVLGRPQPAVRWLQGLTQRHSQRQPRFGQAAFPVQKGSRTLRLPEGKPSGSQMSHFAPLSPASGPLTSEAKPVCLIFVESCEKLPDFFSY